MAKKPSAKTKKTNTPEGFIPWDDDVDVYMPRGDYERFLAEAPAILPPEFEVLSSRSHPDYPKTFGILGLVGSTFTPQVARNRKFPIPIGIDLFPLDPIPEDPSAFSRQARSTWLWGSYILDYCGINREEMTRLVMGGPMMGLAQ